MNMNNSTDPDTATAAAGVVSVATSRGDPHMPSAAVMSAMPSIGDGFAPSPSPGRRHQEAEPTTTTTTPKTTPTKGKGNKWRDRLDAKKHKQQQQQQQQNQQQQNQQEQNQQERENNTVLSNDATTAVARIEPEAMHAATTQTVVDLCNIDDNVRTNKNPNNNNNGDAVGRKVTNHKNNANGKNTTHTNSSKQDDFYDLVMEEELCFDNTNPYKATEDGPRNNTTTQDIPRSNMSSSLPVILESADEYSSSSNSSSSTTDPKEKENAATVDSVMTKKVRRTTKKKQNRGRAGDKWRNRLAVVHQKRKNHRNNTTEGSTSPRHTSDCSSPTNTSTTSTRSSCSLNKIVTVSMTEDPGTVSDISEEFTTPPGTRRRSSAMGARSRGDEPVFLGSAVTTTSPRRTTASEPEVAATHNSTDDAAVTTTTAAVVVVATAARKDDGHRVDNEANRHTLAGPDTEALIPRRPGGRSYGSLVHDHEDATVDKEPEAKRRGATTTPSAPKEEASSDEDEDGSRRFYALVVYPLLIFLVALIVRAIFQMQSIS